MRIDDGGHARMGRNHALSPVQHGRRRIKFDVKSQVGPSFRLEGLIGTKAIRGSAVPVVAGKVRRAEGSDKTTYRGIVIAFDHAPTQIIGVIQLNHHVVCGRVLGYGPGLRDIAQLSDVVDVLARLIIQNPTDLALKHRRIFPRFILGIGDGGQGEFCHRLHGEDLDGEKDRARDARGCAKTCSLLSW